MAERKYKLPYEEYTDSTDVGADKLFLSAAQQTGIDREKINWQKARDAGDQAGMDEAHKRAEAIRAQSGYSGGANGGAYNPFAGDDGQGVHTSGTHMTSPTWTPSYAKERADTVSQIKSRAPFSYDPEKDQTYQQYKQQYERGAAKAMEDTMGQVMARTGGLASSFAQTAGQQSYAATMAQLADKVPELRQLAYQMYMDEGDRLRSDLQMYDNLDSSDASRWQGTVLSPFLSDRAYAKDMDDTLYSRGQDALDRKWQEKLFDTERDDVAFERAQQEKREQEARDLALAELLASGGNYSGYGKTYGMSQADMDALGALWSEDRGYAKKSADLDLQQKVAQIAATNRSNRGSGGGRNSGGSGGDETGDPLDVILNMSESDARRTLVNMDLPQWKVNEYMGLWKTAQGPEGTPASEQQMRDFKDALIVSARMGQDVQPIINNIWKRTSKEQQREILEYLKAQGFGVE